MVGESHGRESVLILVTCHMHASTPGEEEKTSRTDVKGRGSSGSPIVHNDLIYVRTDVQVPSPSPLLPCPDSGTDSTCLFGSLRLAHRHHTS